MQYVARYEENVTSGMIASVPSQGNEQMAAGILQVCLLTSRHFRLLLGVQVSPGQVEAILGESEGVLFYPGAGPLHPMMEGDELLECQLGEDEGEEPSVQPTTPDTNGVKKERVQF